MRRFLLLPALLLLVSAPVSAQDGPSDAYAFTRRLNMLSVAAEEGRFVNSFAEDQGQHPPGDFYILSGYWIVGTGGNRSRHGNHHVAQTISSATFCLLERNNLVVKNFRAAVSLAGDSGSLARAGGLYFHRMEEPSFVFVELNFRENRVAAILWDGSAETELKSVALPLWRRDWHRLGVEVQGQRLTVRAKGRTLFTVQLPYEEEKAGFMGLITRADTKARFDDLVVEPLPRSGGRRR